jgi:REP element-mobilizing transposase RayT
VLREAVRRTPLRSPFRIDAWVVLPDHMHCLWTLPPGDADFPGRWRAIKIAFAKSLPKGEPRSPVMTRRSERGLWQRRYWEHTIRDEQDFAVHMGLDAFQPGPHPSLPRDPRVKPGEGGLGRGSTRRTGRARRSAGVARVASIPPDGQASAPSRK